MRDAWDDVTGDVHVLAADYEAQAVGRPAVFGSSRLSPGSILFALSDPGVRFACDDLATMTAPLRTQPLTQALYWHSIVRNDM